MLNGKKHLTRGALVSLTEFLAIAHTHHAFNGPLHFPDVFDGKIYFRTHLRRPGVSPFASGN